MSQWGSNRSFPIDGGGYIRVTAHVDGPTWSKLKPHHLIDDLLMMEVCNVSTELAMEKLAELKREWIGKRYNGWIRSTKEVESIAQLKPGTIIRHVNGHEGYIVTANYGDHAIAVRTKHISNPREWLIVEE